MGSNQEESKTAVDAHEKDYQFTLTTQMTVYPELPSYTYPNPLTIRIVDYCVALTYGPVVLTVPDKQTLVDGVYNDDFSFVKYVATDPTFIIFEKLSYTPWESRLPVDTGCGRLVFSIVESTDEEYDPDLFTTK